MELFDSHIHLDQFSDTEIEQILHQPKLHSCLAVATNLVSCKRLYQLKQRFPQIHIAAGFHPEQRLPSQAEIDALFDWIEQHHHALSAISEVGLPHYTKREQPELDYSHYLALLERFICLSKRVNLPLNLHIVYQDTPLALTLLAKHQIQRAHFHWFKADDELIQQLLATPYFVSFTPDILWNPKTQKIARNYPLDRILIETDAPYPQEGFKPHETAKQLEATLYKLAELKNLHIEEVAAALMHNASDLYSL